MILKVIVVSLAGAFLCLDRVVLQVMISRPIVAAPVIGLVLGDPYTGLIAGAFIELFWIDRLPIGAYIPPNDTMTAILITASSIESARLLGSMSQGLIALCVLIFVPFGVLAQRMDLWISQGNEKLTREAMNDAARGDIRAIADKHLSAILKTYLLSVAFIMIALPIGIATIAWLYPRLAPFVIRGLTLLYSLLPLLGAAVALSTINLRGTVPIFCAIFLAATVVIGLIRSS
ncbi:MAG: PTS sugar transporter subunit IIC [Syntrophales bacterium]